MKKSVRNHIQQKLGKRNGLLLIPILSFAIILSCFCCVTWDTMNEIERANSIDKLIPFTLHEDPQMRDLALIRLAKQQKDQRIFEIFKANLRNPNSEVKNNIVEYLCINYDQAYDELYQNIMMSKSIEDAVLLLKSLYTHKIILSPETLTHLHDFYAHPRWDLRFYSSLISANNGIFDGAKVLTEILYGDFSIARRLAAKNAREIKSKQMCIALVEFTHLETDETALLYARESLSILLQTFPIPDDELSQIKEKLDKKKAESNQTRSDSIGESIVQESENEKSQLSRENTRVINDNYGPVLAVLDFVNANLSKQDVQLIVDLLSSAIVNKVRYRVIERSLRQTILSEIEFSNAECSDISCQLQIGQLLAADLIVVGSIGKIGEKYLMNTKIVDVETSHTRKTVYKFYDSIQGLTEDCDVIAAELCKN